MNDDFPVYRFSAEKNKKLIVERQMSFEEVIAAIYNNQLVDVVAHPNQKYPDQQLYVVAIRGYLYWVPFVLESDGSIFLKTVLASRKSTKQYLGDVSHEHKKNKSL